MFLALLAEKHETSFLSQQFLTFFFIKNGIYFHSEQPGKAKLDLKLSQPEMHAVLGFPYPPSCHCIWTNRKMTWLSLGQNLLVSVSHSKAVFNPQRYSQLKCMKKYVYLLKKKKKKKKKAKILEDSHFLMNSCFTGKFQISHSIWKDKVIMTQCCHLLLFGGLIWISNNCSNQNN